MLSNSLKQYSLITANYWAFTLTDGALRMLLLLYFANLGYGPLAVAMLFIFYEVFGVFTNLFGGYLGAKIGLNKTMNLGLLLQIGALAMLLVPNEQLTIALVMVAQAISGVAKDLNKLSAKSAIKLLVDDDKQSALFRWVALLTGSKNALKGAGFFLGALLLYLGSFKIAILSMLVMLVCVGINSVIYLQQDIGKSSAKPKFKQIFSASAAINRLSLARLFLFAARDVWFVVAIPMYLSVQLAWDHYQVGTFMALWIIGYGVVQTLAPSLLKRITKRSTAAQSCLLASALALFPAAIALSLVSGLDIAMTIIIGLFGFGVLFAINSSWHSYLIVSYADRDKVSLNVGFYYAANALGRLTGTVLSGYLYSKFGLVSCLVVSSVFITIAALASLSLPGNHTQANLKSI